MNKLVFYITNSSVQNTGDVALLIATVQSIKQKIPSAKIIVEVSHPNNVRHFEELKNLQLYPRILDIQSLDNENKLVTILKGGIDVVTFSLCALLQRVGLKSLSFAVVRPNRKQQAKALSESTVLLSAAGGYLNTRYTHYSLRLYMYLLGLLWQKRVILFTQSIGPFETRASRILIPAVLNKVHAIAVREPASFDYLKQFKIKAPIALTSDIAFLFKAKKNQKRVSENVVAFCVKQTNDISKRANYRTSIIAAVKHLIKKGYKVLIVSHVHGDDALSEELALAAGCQAEKSSPDVYHFKQIYQQCSFVVSSRMHCMILASEFSTPFIAISYEPKFEGLARQLDYPSRFVLSEDTLQAKDLIIAIDQLINERERLKTSLTLKYESLRREAEANLDWLIKVSFHRPKDTSHINV